MWKLCEKPDGIFTTEDGQELKPIGTIRNTDNNQRVQITAGDAKGPLMCLPNDKGEYSKPVFPCLYPPDESSSELIKIFMTNFYPKKEKQG
jgi:hypothetical protein